MWTFTIPVKVEPRVAARLWSNLARDLVRVLGMWGIRVYEPHPGGHGLHVHVIVSGRYDVNKVRSYSDRHGFGRIHVCKVDSPEYVAKYLSKSRRRNDWKGIRLWASFGVKRARGWQPSKVRDIEVESPTGVLYRKLAAVTNPKTYVERYRLLKLCQQCTLGALRYTIRDSVTGYIVTMSGAPAALDRPEDWLRVSGKNASVVFVDVNSGRHAFTITANLKTQPWVSAA